MAYGYLCKHCGHYEASHKTFEFVDENKIVPGYKYSLLECCKRHTVGSGFTYSQSDYSAVVEEYIKDPVEGFPKFLKKRADKKIEEAEEKNPTILNHAVWTLLSNGMVVDIGS